MSLEQARKQLEKAKAAYAAELKKELACLQSRTEKSDSTRKTMSAARKEYWRKVYAGEIKRKGFKPNEG